MAYSVLRRRRSRLCPAARRHNNSNPARRAPLNPLLSGVSPCPKLEPPSGVNLSPAAWASPCRPRPSPAQAISHALIGYDPPVLSIYPNRSPTPKVRDSTPSQRGEREQDSAAGEVGWAGRSRRPTAPRQMNLPCQMNQHSGALSNHWPNRLASAHLEL